MKNNKTKQILIIILILLVLLIIIIAILMNKTGGNSDLKNIFSRKLKNFQKFLKEKIYYL